MERMKLCDVIKKELAGRHMSQGMLADRLGVAPESLRTWLHRNCFPLASLKKISDIIGLDVSPEQAEEKFDFSWARPMRARTGYEPNSLASAFETADQEQTRVATLLKPTSDLIVKFCETMTENDIMIMMSATVTPWEMEPHVGKEMRTAIIEGVRRGGRYLYLRPRQTLVKKWMDSPLGFNRIPDEDTSRKEIAKFREVIVDTLQSTGTPYAEAEDMAYRATPQYYVRDDLPFLVPGFVIMMFRSGRVPGNEIDRLVVRLPDNAWATLYLAGATYFHERFHRTIGEALEDEAMRLHAEKKKFERKRGINHINTSAKNDVARDTEILEEIRRHLFS